MSMNIFLSLQNKINDFFILQIKQRTICNLLQKFPRKSASYQSPVKASKFSLVKMKTLWYVSKCLQYFLFGLGRPKEEPGPSCLKGG